MKIYTKTGDDGTTALFDGTRVKKNNARIDLYGDVDEINAAVGLANSFVSDRPFKAMLHQVQKGLFALGARLANPKDKKQKDKAQFDAAKITWLENQIDSMQEKITPMKTFILPGGNTAAGALHVARTVCRRAERKLVGLTNKHPLDPVYLKYLNRLSDYLFVAARYANHLVGEEDIPW